MARGFESLTFRKVHGSVYYQELRKPQGIEKGTGRPQGIGRGDYSHGGSQEVALSSHRPIVECWRNPDKKRESNQTAMT